MPVETVALARYLIGTVLVRVDGDAVTTGRIVETEAYLPGDASSHAYRGPTARNRSMFLAPGHAYVYRIYGTSFCFNVSAEPEGHGGGVLIRAAEPMEGIPLMAKRRGTEVATDLARGPGRLAQAFAIDLDQDGLDLCADQSLWLAETPDSAVAEIGTSTRIGLTREAHRELRFFERGNRFVSGTKRLNA